ncbi:hypothetical protein [Roseibium aggregatum]|uniref:Uncharacterized protein n=1 Tax=Roseibium aggregatum TaxID=187304 RepID=A0A926P3R3_9HYPH|nr:hypothetical protein [Roseibium aggregatum]MBD1549138.1 hypothetical protein [Roseibium aggregatum]
MFRGTLNDVFEISETSTVPLKGTSLEFQPSEGELAEGDQIRIGSEIIDVVKVDTIRKDNDCLTSEKFEKPRQTTLVLTALNRSDLSRYLTQIARSIDPGEGGK